MRKFSFIHPIIILHFFIHLEISRLALSHIHSRVGLYLPIRGLGPFLLLGEGPGPSLAWVVRLWLFRSYPFFHIELAVVWSEHQRGFWDRPPGRCSSTLRLRPPSVVCHAFSAVRPFPAASLGRVT